jgi:hypothetical protein
MKCLAVEESTLKQENLKSQRTQSIQGEQAHLLTWSSGGSSVDARWRYSPRSRRLFSAPSAFQDFVFSLPLCLCEWIRVSSADRDWLQSGEQANLLTQSSSGSSLDVC